MDTSKDTDMTCVCLRGLNIQKIYRASTLYNNAVLKKYEFLEEHELYVCGQGYFSWYSHSRQAGESGD
jgi:hypothetical protein